MTGLSDRALTVFGPEVLMSGLFDDLTTFIAQKAEVRLADRFLAVHDKRSITRFYDMTSSTGRAHWPLVIDLFDGRPCIASVWEGQTALSKIQALKGATHPSDASASTVRGSFACDNPVCNLIHVSDSAELVGEELALLRTRQIGFANGSSSPSAGTVLRQPYNAHSALLVFLDLLQGVEPALKGRIRIAQFASSLAAAKSAFASLEKIRSDFLNLRDVVDAFLAEDFAEVVALWPAGSRWSSWERLLVECGCHSNLRWLRRLELEDTSETRLCL